MRQYSDDYYYEHYDQEYGDVKEEVKKSFLFHEYYTYCFCCQDHEGSGSGDAAQEEAELLLLPKFLSHPQNVTVIEGSSFDLHCIVDNLGKQKTLNKRAPIVFLNYFKNSNQNQKFYNGG